MLFKSRARERGMADRDVADDLCFKPRQPPWSYTTAKKGGISKDVGLCVGVCVCSLGGGGRWKEVEEVSVPVTVRALTVTQVSSDRRGRRRMNFNPFNAGPPTEYPIRHHVCASSFLC